MIQIYTAVALYELHLPLLQYGKRAWETGEMPTEQFRESLFEPRSLILEAMDLLKARFLYDVHTILLDPSLPLSLSHSRNLSVQ